MSATESQPAVDTATITFPADARFFTLARLVVGGIGTRFDLPYDQVGDLQLMAEILAATAVQSPRGSDVTLEVAWSEDWVELATHVDGAVALDEPADGIGLERLFTGLGARLVMEDGEQGTTLRARQPIARAPGQ